MFGITSTAEQDCELEGQGRPLPDLNVRKQTFVFTPVPLIQSALVRLRKIDKSLPFLPVRRCVWPFYLSAFTLAFAAGDPAQHMGQLVGRVWLVQQLEPMCAILGEHVAVAGGQHHRQLG